MTDDIMVYLKRDEYEALVSHNAQLRDLVRELLTAQSKVRMRALAVIGDRITAEDAGNVVMPFGKYIGKRINELPQDYLAWLLTLKNLSPELRNAVFEFHQGEGEVTEQETPEQEVIAPVPF